MLDSGFRISDLNNIPVNGKDCNSSGKIALDNTYLLSYSHTIYGINYNKQNYKIPLNSLRDDIKGYIGIESIVSPWSEQMKLWHGTWDNKANKNKSYVYEWHTTEINDPHYNPEKFNDLENSYYIIKDCPFPFETENQNNRDNKGEKQGTKIAHGLASTETSINVPLAAADPYPESNKFVTKKYIDERLASKRLVEVGTDFYVRDYDCTYVIRQETLANEFNKEIIIRYPEEFNNRVLHNTLTFTLLIEGKWNESEQTWESALNDPTCNWKLYNSSGEKIDLIWLNDGENKTPIIFGKDSEYLYGNSQYILIRFQTATDDFDVEEITETNEGGTIVVDYEKTANFKTFAVCENLIYRGSGIKTVNDESGTALSISSSNNTVLHSTKVEGSLIKVDLKTDIRTKDSKYLQVETPTATKKYWNISATPTNIKSNNSYITVTPIQNKPNEFTLTFNESELPEVSQTPLTNISGDAYITVNPVPNKQNNFTLAFNAAKLPPSKKILTKLASSNASINLSTSHGKIYYTTFESPTISFTNYSSLSTNESITIELYYKTGSNDSKITIGGGIPMKWAMSAEAPTFKPNRLYNITFTYFPDISGFTSPKIVGRINWFEEL